MFSSQKAVIASPYPTHAFAPPTHDLPTSYPLRVAILAFVDGEMYCASTRKLRIEAQQKIGKVLWDHGASWWSGLLQG